MPNLDDYELAFDRAGAALEPGDPWPRFERVLRRHRRGPALELAGTLLALAACVAGGLAGVWNAWLVAGFLVLVALPDRWRALQGWRSDLAAVERAEDLQRLCAAQAKRQMAKALLRALLLGGLALLYLLTGIIAHLLGKSGAPGTVAGLLVLAWGVYQLLVRLPRAAREWAVLDPASGRQDRTDEDGDGRA